MLLSLNETRDQARVFARGWAGDASERAAFQTFCNQALTPLLPAEKKKPASRKRKTEESL